MDADYKLKDMKKLTKDWEMKGKAFRKRVDDIHINLSNHMNQ